MSVTATCDALGEAPLLRGASAQAIAQGRCSRRWERACRFPGLVPPVRLGGTLLVDGGVLNNLPVDHMAESGEGPVVAVEVIRRLEGEESAEPRIPTITETLARATVLASAERAKRNRELALLLATPEVQSIGLREWSALGRAIEAGRIAMTQALETGGAERLRAALDAPV